MQNLEEIIRIARGESPADLVLKNGILVNLFSGEIYPSDVAIYQHFIVGINNSYEGKEVIDLKGEYIIPGMIDGHIHIESSMLRVPEFAKVVVSKGTTAVIIDPHEIANVFGIEGIQYMLRSSRSIPLDVFIMLPSCVPATPFETSGASLSAIDIFPLLKNEQVLGLAEVMDFESVLHSDTHMLDKLKMMQGYIIDGHAPSLTGKNLCAYIATGIHSDHECSSAKEAKEKLEKGMYIMIREGSSAKNLEALFPCINEKTENMCIFVTDDKNARDLYQEGHMDAIVKKGMRLGLGFLSAIKMCTINTARYFKLPNVGAVAPGFMADIVTIDNPHDFHIKKVFKHGTLVAQEGKICNGYFPDSSAISPIRASVNFAPLQENAFQIHAHSSTCRVIEIIPGQLITNEFIYHSKIKDGLIHATIEDDIMKIAVIERHFASGDIAVALVKGFGLTKGAIASTVAHDSHNIIVIGTNDKDMLTAVLHLRDIQGGFSFAMDGNIIADVPLPVAGLMSTQPVDTLISQLKKMESSLRKYGVILHDPFITLSFLALPVIPKLKITNKGLFNVESSEFVDVCISE